MRALPNYLVTRPYPDVLVAQLNSDHQDPAAFGQQRLGRTKP